MKRIVLIFLLLTLTNKFFPQYSHCSSVPTSQFPLILNAPTRKGDINYCQDKIKVIDEKPVDCTYNGNTVLYPVFVENFNFKEDLPNNFRFDNFGSNPNGDGSYYLNAFNNNIFCQNGELNIG